MTPIVTTPMRALVSILQHPVQALLVHKALKECLAELPLEILTALELLTARLVVLRRHPVITLKVQADDPPSSLTRLMSLMSLHAAKT